ncbi:MAG: glycosyltransferase family 2 protein [Pseudonocardia sp.]
MPDLSVAVVIASAGRPELLAEAITTCRAQAGIAFTGVVSVPDPASLPDDRAVLDGWQVVSGARGLAAQRNAALSALRDHDLVAFFDDDAVPGPDYLARAAAFLAGHPDVQGITGRVLADGKLTGEIDRDVATSTVARACADPPTGRWRRTRELYGCNFVVRFGSARQVRFDERLPLYSWLEDHDFARRLRRLGPLAEVDDCVLVHRAAASGGRQAHERLGYSQVMNPVYLHRKGSFPLWLAAQQIFRPVAKNIALATAGPAADWRRERLRGNALAARDALRGRITPERIVELRGSS